MVGYESTVRMASERTTNRRPARRALTLLMLLSAATLATLVIAGST